MTLAVLLLNLLPALLTGIPGISTKIKQIITDLTGATSAVLTSGVVTLFSVNTVLAAWAGVLTALQADPNLPQDKLGLVAGLGKIVQAALLEDTIASQKVDWTKFTSTANV